MEGKLRTVFGKPRTYLFDPVGWTVDPWGPHVNENLHLTSVQMPLNVLWRIIIKPLKRIAYRAAKPNVRFMVCVNVNPLRLVINYHLLYEPGRAQPEDLGKQKFVVHGY